MFVHLVRFPFHILRGTRTLHNLRGTRRPGLRAREREGRKLVGPRLFFGVMGSDGSDELDDVWADVADVEPAPPALAPPAPAPPAHALRRGRGRGQHAVGGRGLP